jgi:outer membrane assembly lipoprotein YfiO
MIISDNGFAFWIWTPKEKTIINPKFVVKDTPQEQFEWAMRFYKNGDFQRAADEFIRLTKYYPDAEEAPEAQYYAGRAFEEQGRYFSAFQNFQKTVENYPYTKRLEEINERIFHIGKIMQSEESPKLMELELSLALDRSITIFNKVVENSPFGPYADKALFQLAVSARKLHRYSEAMDAYERIITDYPESELVAEARYELAYTRYEASLSPEYDQESTDRALKEFKQISKTTPVPSISKEAEAVLDELREKKALSMMKIAEFYEKRKKFRSAVIYYKDIIGKFPETRAADAARERVQKLKGKIKK